jgi:hypothetical protein
MISPGLLVLLLLVLVGLLAWLRTSQRARASRRALSEKNFQKALAEWRAKQPALSPEERLRRSRSRVETPPPGPPWIRRRP